MFFQCEAFPKNELRRENRRDKIGNGVCGVPIWRKKTEEGKGRAAEPLEIPQKSHGPGGSCPVWLLPRIPLPTSFCISVGSFCIDPLLQEECRRGPRCRYPGPFVFLWFQCIECMLRLGNYRYITRAIDALSKMLENPLQKRFWGVCAFPYYCF